MASAAAAVDINHVPVDNHHDQEEVMPFNQFHSHPLTNLVLFQAQRPLQSHIEDEMKDLR